VRCSVCSEVIKPIVAVDIDGVMADYHGHFLDFARAYLQTDIHRYDYRGDEEFNRWFCDTYKVTYDTWQDIKLAYRQGGMKRSQPVIPYALDLLLDLNKRDVEVWITTTRPYLRLDNIDPDTRFWLENTLKADGLYHGLLYSDDKYMKLAEIVDRERVIAVLDDLPELCDTARILFGIDVPILISTRWNESVSFYNKQDLNHARTSVIQRLRDWEIINSDTWDFTVT
jgi:hypothetical protein